MLPAPHLIRPRSKPARKDAASTLASLTIRRLPLIAAASTALALSLTGCMTPHDLSLPESCKQWQQLGKGKWPDVRDDLVSAEPKMYEAVAKQVKNYYTAMGSPASKCRMATLLQSYLPPIGSTRSSASSSVRGQLVHDTGIRPTNVLRILRMLSSGPDRPGPT